MKNSFTLAAGAALILALSPLGAKAETKDVVTSIVSGEVVTYGKGECVRTKWDVGSTQCDRTVRAPAPTPAPTILSLDREARIIYFDFNKTNLVDDAVRKLDNLISMIQGSKEVRSATIVGYADRIGGNDYNQKLSERRAQTVQEYFTRKGYLNTDVKLSAMGESNPQTNCGEGTSKKALIRCLNNDRRVEIEINLYR